MFDVSRVTRRATAPMLACALTLTASAACSSGGATGAAGEDGGGDAQGGSTTTVPEGPFATGRRTLTLVDTDRTTDEVPGVQPERPDRTLEVEVVYPATGEPGPEPTGEPGRAGASVEDAPPAAGAFPLVVFAHGFSGRGDLFAGFAERWAREGYVVALPTFPLSRGGIEIAADVANQPGDVSFVIDELGGLDGGDPLAGHVDLDHVAVGGHSLGAVTVFGVAYNSCCLDERVDATIPVAGASLPFEGGTYDDRPATPMLLVHGVQDETVPIGVGDAMFDQAEAPVWYLRPADGTHSTVFAGAPGRLFNDAMLAFLDAQLRGDDDALDALDAELSANDAAEWRTKPAAVG